MQITTFTVIMAVLLSTVLVLVVHCLRKKAFFLRTFGVHTVLLLYLFCILRMVLPVEFSFSVPVGIPVYDNLANILSAPLLHSQWNVGKLLVFLWLAGAILFLLAFFVQEISVSWQMRKHLGMHDELADWILETVKGEAPRKVDVPVRLYKEGLDMPIGMGLIHLQICLPDREYNPKELYYILKHEYTHFCNRDLQIKFLVRLYCCLFWWNPTVWLLKKDIAQILEIKCDLTATQAFSHAEKSEYLAVILRSVMELREHNAPHISSVGTPLFAADSEREMVERFKLITNPGKNPASRRTTVFITFAALAFAGSYLFVFQPAHSVPVGTRSDNGLLMILALLACCGCGYSDVRIDKKRVEETVMFLLTEIHYRLSRTLGKSIILVLAAVMLVTSMGAYLGNFQSSQAALDNLAESIPVTARVLSRDGTQSSRIAIDTGHFDSLTSMNVNDVRCTSGAAGAFTADVHSQEPFAGGDTAITAVNCFEAVPAFSEDNVIYFAEFGPGYLSSNQAVCGISDSYAEKMGLALGEEVSLPVYTATLNSQDTRYTYVGEQTLQVVAVYPYHEINGERTPDMTIPVAWLRNIAESAGTHFYYSSLSVALADPMHLTQFKENLIPSGFVPVGTANAYGASDAISVEDELFIKTAEELRDNLQTYRLFQLPFYGMITAMVMLTVFLVLRNSRKDMAIASSLGEARLRISLVHFFGAVLTQMAGGVLASMVLVAYAGIGITDSLWILLAYLLCATVGTILALLQLMRFDALTLLTQPG